MKKDFYYPVPIGSNCLIAHHLDKSNLRKESLPFDWIFLPSCKIFEYVTELLRKEFSDFMENMKYDSDKYVECTNYEGTKYMHHDLIGNVDARATMEKRCKRFITQVTTKKPLFICSYELFYSTIPDANTVFADTVKEFQAELKRRGIEQYEILLIIYDNHEFVVNEGFVKSLTDIGVHVRTFVRDCNVDINYGSELTFKPILEEFYTL